LEFNRTGEDKVKAFVIALALVCAVQTVRADDDSIKAVVQARRARKAKAARVVRARDVAGKKQDLADARAAEVMRRRAMEDQAHAAQVQHAINGHNANMVQAQSNAVQAERNRVLAESNRALLRAQGVLICSNCGEYGHTICGRR
jgi:hypothetical protein